MSRDTLLRQWALLKSLSRRRDLTIADDFTGVYGTMECGVTLRRDYVGSHACLRELNFNGVGRVSSTADDELEVEHHYGSAPVRQPHPAHSGWLFHTNPRGAFFI